jgi:hypothetical protein
VRAPADSHGFPSPTLAVRVLVAASCWTVFQKGASVVGRLLASDVFEPA